MEFRKQVTRHKTTFKIPQENYTSKKQTHTHTNAHCNNKLKTEKKLSECWKWTMRVQ